jgi:hypothetical protein
MSRLTLVVFAIVTTGLMWGCGAPPPRPRPDDFQATYTWSEGSLPPPHHYWYTVRVGPGGRGEIEYHPDYAFNNPPVWTETFGVDDAALERLYLLMAQQGVFTQQWRRRDSPPVGGSSDSLAVIAHGEQFAIPSSIADDNQARAAGEVYTAIKALAPEATWAKLTAQREQYVSAALRRKP